MNGSIMKDSTFSNPINSGLLMLLLFLGQSMPTCMSQSHLNADVDSIPSIARGAQLPINLLIESILKHVSAPSGKSGNPNIVVHINNLYCVSDSNNVQINPCKQQVINVARGDQVVNLENPRDLTKRSLPINDTTFGDKYNETKSRNCHQRSDSFVEQMQSDQPWNLAPARPEGCKVDLPLNVESHDRDRAPENSDIHLDIPALNIFIDGKHVPESSKPGTHSSEELSSKLFKEELRELLENGNTVKKRLLCHRKDPPPCDHDSVTFRSGLELSYEEFEKIIDNVSERPNALKLIVPGGVTGPLSGYFQKVDNSLHGHALVHGVCHLDNGLLVPAMAMLRILKLQAWLYEMDPDSQDADVSKLLASIKSTRTDSIVDLMRCFVKSNKVQVALPGMSEVPFAQFEQEDEHIPTELLKRAKVEILGFRIPYIEFRDQLVALCRETAD